VSHYQVYYRVDWVEGKPWRVGWDVEIRVREAGATELLSTSLGPQRGSSTIATSLRIAKSPAAHHQRLSERSIMAKPGADLLWAFQLHREHGALAKRLKALENTTTQQQERISADEQSARSAYDQRLDALARQLQSLQESEVTEQVAGLASELRVTRQHVDQARDKVKSIESASKEIDGKIQESERAVHARFGGLESILAQVQRALLGFEGRLQLAAQHGARITTGGLEETRQRHGDDIAQLSERLRGLQDAQTELRALVESVVRDGHKAPAAAPVLTQTITAPPNTNTTMTSYTTHMPNLPHAVPALDETTPSPLNTTTASHTTTTIPDLQPTKAKTKQAKPPAKAKRFEKEIASLIYGEGSLTNAPDIMQSQLPQETSKGGSKKRKAPVDEGPLLHSAFTQRETRSQAKKVKEEPTATRAKAPAKPAKPATVRARPASKKEATRQAANTITTTTRVVKKEPGRNLRRARSPMPERPLPRSSSDEIQVAISQEVVASPTPTPLPLASRGKGKGKEKAVIKREQQPQRRRIKQDDSMEEFLAKIRASTGGTAAGSGGA
jgi:hypothetical protein